MRPGVGEGGGCLRLPSPSVPGPAKPQVPPRLRGRTGAGRGGESGLLAEEVSRATRVGQHGDHHQNHGPRGASELLPRVLRLSTAQSQGGLWADLLSALWLGPPTLSSTNQVLIFGSGALAVFDREPGVLAVAGGV